MVIEKYNIEIDDSVVTSNLNRICNQIYKLLPMREEGKNWIKPLETLIIEITGVNSLVSDQKDLFTLLCKLEGLYQQGENIEFKLYRRSIFECCGLAEQVRNNVNANA